MTALFFQALGVVGEQFKVFQRKRVEVMTTPPKIAKTCAEWRSKLCFQLGIDDTATDESISYAASKALAVADIIEAAYALAYPLGSKINCRDMSSLLTTEQDLCIVLGISTESSRNTIFFITETHRAYINQHVHTSYLQYFDRKSELELGAPPASAPPSSTLLFAELSLAKLSTSSSDSTQTEVSAARCSRASTPTP